LLNEYQPGQGILPHTDGPRYEDCTATLSLGSDIVIEFTKRLTSSEIGSGKQAASTTLSTVEASGERKVTDNNHSMEKNVTDNTPRVNTGNQSSSNCPIQVLLEAGSLLFFQEDAYMNYCHGIGMDVWRDVTTENCLNADSGIIVPRGLRYSLTFRHKKTETKE
jgi:alkylated DNA repair protein alkB family protein 6